MDRKEKKKLLSDIESAQNYLNYLQTEISTLEKDLKVKKEELKQLTDELDKYKMREDLDQSIERLKKDLAYYEEKNNNYYDVQDVVFAPYTIVGKRSENFLGCQLGVFKVSKKGAYTIYNHIFAPTLCGIIDGEGINKVSVDNTIYSTIYIYPNVITFFDVLPFMDNPIVKNKVSLDDVMEVYNLVINMTDVNIKPKFLIKNN